MFASVKTISLAEWIIDDTCLVLSYSFGTNKIGQRVVKATFPQRQEAVEKATLLKSQFQQRLKSSILERRQTIDGPDTIHVKYLNFFLSLSFFSPFFFHLQILFSSKKKTGEHCVFVFYFQLPFVVQALPIRVKDRKNKIDPPLLLVVSHLGLETSSRSKHDLACFLLGGGTSKRTEVGQQQNVVVLE